MLTDLKSVATAVFSALSQVWALYMSGSVLSGVFLIWLFRKVARLFDKLK